MASKAVIGGQECFQVFDHEFLLEGMVAMGDQVCLAILKKAGAPIVGDLWLHVDPAYSVGQHRDDLGRRTFFCFQKFESEKTQPGR